MDILDFQAQVNELQLNTERLVIKRHTDADLPLVLEHETNPEIMRYIKDIDDDISVVEAAIRNAFLPWHAEDGRWCMLGIFTRQDELYIGNVFFRFESIDFGRVEIGYRLHPNFHKQGYAVEAVSALNSFLWQNANVNKLLAYCVAQNQDSSTLMSKLGMQQEARLREHSTLGGIWYDELVYAVLRRER